MSEVLRLHEASAPAKPEGQIAAFWAMAAFLDAHRAQPARRGRLGAILGPSGTGKTWGLRQYENDGRATVYCRMARVAATPHPFLFRLCTVLGVYVSPNAGLSELFDAALAELERRYTALVVLDEAQHLHDDSLHAVRDLYDLSGAGIVLAGEPWLAERWRAPRGRTPDRFAAFRGRLRVLHLEPPSGADIDVLCTLHGIAGKRSRELVEGWLRRPGCLHNLDERLAIARELAGPAGRVDHRHLVDADRIAGGA